MSSTAQRRDTIRDMQRPGSTDRGLPNEFFVDERHYETEQRRMFRSTWVFAGVEQDLRSRGSVVPLEVAGVPLIATFASDDDVAIFENVCPHRGARLVSEPSSRQRIVCPYHSWTYGHAGQLLRRPHVESPGVHAGPGEDTDCISLLPVRFERWHGALLVNLDGQAEDFAEFIGPLDEVADEYGLEPLRYASKISSDFDANWKLVIENFLDAYHVFAIHKQTLDPLMSPESRKAALGVGNLVYCDFVGTPEQAESYGDLPLLPGLVGDLRRTSIYGVQFPNMGIVIHPAYLMYFHFVPVAVNRTRADLYAFFVGDAATDPALESSRTALLDYYATLNVEDADACRLIQEGRQAPSFDGGRLAPYWDGGTLHFASLVRQGMTR